MNRVGACFDTKFLESELEVVPFQQFPSDTPVPKFDSLPEGPWRHENLPLIREVAADYLKKKKGGGGGTQRTSELVYVYVSVDTCMMLR